MKTLEQNKIVILEEYCQGLGTRILSKKYGCSQPTMHKFIVKYGETRKRSDKYGTVKNFDQEIINLHFQGVTACEIARQLNFTDVKILNRAKRLGISFSNGFRAGSNIDRIAAKKDKIFELYNKGYGVKKIADLIDDNYSAIRKLLIDNGFNLNKGRVEPWTKYEVNEIFFEKIDSEVKAYVLGWWYADGCVRPSDISLSITDIDILQEISKCFNYTGPIYTISPPKEFPHRKTMYRLTIGRQKLVKDITKLGCGPAKSLTLKFPSLEQVSPEFLRDFIRGWFDGDGSISFSKNKNVCSINLVGTKEFLKEVQKIIGFTGYWYQNKISVDKNTYCIRIGKQSEIKKFLTFIYKDATIFLKRKKDRGDLFLAAAGV